MVRSRWRFERKPEEETSEEKIEPGREDLEFELPSREANDGGGAGWKTGNSRTGTVLRAGDCHCFTNWGKRPAPSLSH